MVRRFSISCAFILAPLTCFPHLVLLQASLATHYTILTSYPPASVSFKFHNSTNMHNCQVCFKMGKRSALLPTSL
ncbi:hypothetical protein J3E72DRAFT_342642 [Bipolaris maydis]|nr:hypothetical protein J3E73DRAFT_327101 [Bipolaris maydis]KAJ6194855.1 hypothetical protein J3E72DRAFT_342642 [Bipolaris maydis]